MYLEKIKENYQKLTHFLNQPNVTDENYQDLFQILNIHDKNDELRDILHLIANIANNYNQSHDFFNKIERILTNYAEIIKKNFLNMEIFNIFKGNKRIILFLIKKHILKFDQEIAYFINNEKYSKLNYPAYFYPELKETQSLVIAKNPTNFETASKLFSDNSELFEKNRQIGENDNILCEIIRNDSLDEFQSYLKQNSLSLNEMINQSIFETHPLLMHKRSTLIEYSAFFGSIQIFKYLVSQKVNIELSIWKYAIHSGNIKIIQFIEENQISPEECSFQELLKESIKCHHNYITDYIIKKYFHNEIPEIFLYSIRYHNFNYFHSDFNDDTIFFSLCKYDYATLVNYIIEEGTVNIDCKIVEKRIKKEVGKEVKESKIHERTPFYVASERGNNAIINILLSRNDKIDINKKLLTKCFYFYKNESFERSSLCIAIEERNVHTVKLLLSLKDIDVNQKSTYKFVKESRNDDKYIETQEKSPLHLAVENQLDEILQLLLINENIKINDKFISDEIGPTTKYHSEKSSLYLAVENNLEKITLILLSNPKIDVNDLMIKSYESGEYYSHKNEASLHLAVAKNYISIVNLLLKRYDTDVNIQKTKKYHLFKENEDKTLTPLQIASKKGLKEITALLLQRHDIDVNCLTKIYRNSLKFNIDQIQMKMKNFAMFDEIGALHLAVQKDHLEIVKLLINSPNIDANKKMLSCYENEHSCDIEYVLNFFNKDKQQEKSPSQLQTIKMNNRKEESALRIAIEKNNMEMVTFLLDSGKVDINSALQEVNNSIFKDYETIDNSITELTVLHVAIEKKM